MNILHVNASDIGGGAARAAYRIHRSLVEHGTAHGLSSQMRVISQLSDDPTVISGPPAGQRPIWRRLQPRLNRQARRGFRTGNPTLHSIAWPATGLGTELQQRQRQGQVDLVHLHWLGDSTLSIEEIGRLPMTLVWTLHDQWAFCGAEHYTSPPLPGETGSSDGRFAAGYSPASRPAHEAGPDLNRRTWLRKRRAWRRPIHIVCPSHWLADCARRSTLMADWPITVIPHPIDLNVWAPCDQAQARALLGLPADRPLVLFGALGGSADPRKGADLLLEALQRLRSQVAGKPLEQLELVVFGQSRPAQPPDLGFPIHYSVPLNDDLGLRLLYAAADVFVIPSRQDNLPNTGLETHACGTPVVAFATGGLVSIVDPHTTGALAEPFDPASLAAGIRWVMENHQRCRQLGEAAAERAESEEELWALKDVSFEIRRGERVGIIGRNGAGKSTLLKILSRITEPTTGRVEIRGRVASLLEVGTGFHPELTGRENIYLNGAILGMTRREIRSKFDEIVDFAEVEKFIDMPVKRYSSGMYVRLEFAVAAHLEPEILVIDEVLAVGDMSFQRKCISKLEDTPGSERTVSFVSHTMSLIEQLTSKTLYLESGRLQQFGSTKDAIKKYSSISGWQGPISYTGANLKRKPGYDGQIMITGLRFCKERKNFSYNENISFTVKIISKIIRI